MSNPINTPRETTLKRIADSLDIIAFAQSGQISDVTSWAGIQQIVRAGLAEKFLPIGTQLRCTHNVYGEIVWDVVAHDYNPDPEGLLEHSMTLLAHGAVVNSLQYDSPEALYYCENELAAGTYYFTLLSGYDPSYGGGASYYFTLTQKVPAGGVLVFPWGYQTQASTVKVSSYSTVSATSAIESVSVTQGTSGTFLGTADGNTANMNHTHRIRYGSNHWGESAMRQFLNSAAAAGSVWKSQTKFDRPPSWASSTAGFMAGLPSEFLAVVGEVDISCKTNGVYELGHNLSTAYTTRDKFWLPSVDELNYATESVAEGKVFPLYVGATNVDRIKYNSAGTARYCWMRSPYPWSAISVRLIYTDGSLNYNSASDSYAVVPACVIR